MQGYIIFTDIEKYSLLDNDDLKTFHSDIAPVIFDKLKTFQDNAIFWNTWGDAIVAVYDNAEMAINMPLVYRDAFREINFYKHGIHELKPRIAGNYGEFELLFDPALGKDNVHGTTVNQTARIEPITIPGEIFVSKIFWQTAMQTYDFKDLCRFDDMGEVSLAKKAGKLNLYRLCRVSDERIKPVGNTALTTYYVPLRSEEEKKREQEAIKREEEERRKQEKHAKFLRKAFAKDSEQEFNINSKDLKEKFNKGYEKNADKKMHVVLGNPATIAFMIFIGSLLTNMLLSIGFAQVLPFEQLVIYKPFLYAISVLLVSLFVSIKVKRFIRKSFSMLDIVIIICSYALMRFLFHSIFYSLVSSNP